MNEDFDHRVTLFLRAVTAKKAQDVVALDVRGLTSIADCFILCHGTSSRQVSAIADHVERELRKHRIRPLSVEGASEGQWVLLDYGDVVVHVFFESTRRLYDLEGLWSDAPRLPLPAVRRTRAPARRRSAAPVEPLDGP